MAPGGAQLAEESDSQAQRLGRDAWRANSQRGAHSRVEYPRPGDGDKIELSVRRRGQEAAIVVSDSGPGIPQDHLDAVFDRFTRAGPPGATGGFGLGLSIVRAFAEAHGGRVTAAAGPLGGAEVTLWLPLLTPPIDSTPDNTRSELPAA